MRLLNLALVVVAATGCKNSESSSKQPMSVAATPNPNRPPDEDEQLKGPQPVDTTREQLRKVDTTKPDYDDPNFKSTAPPAATKKDDKKGDQEDSEWTPAEFKKGQARWKDCGVYLDGQPIGFLSFGEMPIGMPIMWREDEVSRNKAPGTDEPDRRIARQRMYRFTDYLKAVGVDPAKVKELHVYGPRLTNTLIATGADLVSEKGKEFAFRFGANVSGKPIPSTPGKFGHGRVPDKIASVMIYINKKPPDFDPEEGPTLDGRVQLGVPYFGDPIRGGVRIYVDNKLAGIIKRQDLDPKTATKDADGVLHWKLADVLAKLGVNTKKAVELWLVRDERRQEKMAAADAASMSFVANSQSKGGILLGDKKLRANVLAFHSRALKPEEIPAPTKDDE